MSRALRRHHEERLKRQIRKQWQHKLKTRRVTDKDVGKSLHTPTNCSGPCCGNPRKWFNEKSIQERKVEQEY